MAKNKIIVHCLVKNEENFIWYALKSVLPYVDKIMVWDTGSDDKTVEIVKSINSPKIDFKEVGTVDSSEFTEVRNKMLKETDKNEYHWLLILDGDEIWKARDLEAFIQRANVETPDAVVVRTINLVGDIYHHLPQSAGKYSIQGKHGHLGLRLINLGLPNLVVDFPYGGETYQTNGVNLQDLPADNLKVWSGLSYFHATHLVRSSADRRTLKRSFKRKYELGEKINTAELPKVFFQNHPVLVPDVTKPMSMWFWVMALLQTFPKRLRRKYFASKKSGYI